MYQLCNLLLNQMTGYPNDIENTVEFGLEIIFLKKRLCYIFSVGINFRPQLANTFD